MNKFMDLEETRQPAFREIFKELEQLYLESQGKLIALYYKHKYKQGYFFQTFARQWEYPWAIMNSRIKGGERVLDAGCGGSPLLLYLYKKPCLCYGLDNKFSYEIPPSSLYTIKRKFAQKLSDIFPLYFLVNPHGLDGLSNPAKALRFDINYTKGSLTDIPFNDNTFDRIFCISVIEHLSREDMFKTAREFFRVLKPQGLLIVTIDQWGIGLEWQDFIKASGLRLYDETDFNPPPKKKYAYDVVGFVLKKE